MRVINTESWAGEDFSYLPGEEIELPDEIAAARIEAGLAKPTSEPEAAKPAKKPKSTKGE